MTYYTLFLFNDLTIKTQQFIRTPHYSFESWGVF